jgi:phosphoribosylanthranilate isomerase
MAGTVTAAAGTFRGLAGPAAYPWIVFVKICGITTEEDALLAVAMGADAVGFNFVAGSVRQVAVDHARDISRRLPPEVLTVGIFRDETAERVVDLCHRADLRAAQLHGQESPEVASMVRARVGQVIKVFPAGSPAAADIDRYDVDAVMLDGVVPGSGEIFDWALVDVVPDDVPFILAGGLSPDNVVAAIERVRPWGVDVATGVESSPGHKDPIKVRNFVRAAKGE